MTQTFENDWPTAESLKEHINGSIKSSREFSSIEKSFSSTSDDEIFLTLYKEMYFRHIYASKPVNSMKQNQFSNCFFEKFSFFRAAFL